MSANPPLDQQQANAWIAGKHGQSPLALEIADRFMSRFRGLMLRGPLATHPIPSGLLITECSSIHTAFMRYPLDIVYLDGQGNVTRCIPRLAPWRASHSYGTARTRHTLEIPAGTIDQLGIEPGARLHYPQLLHRK